MLSLIIPSHNEENHILPCLRAIAVQTGLPVGHGMQVIVAANGCRDATVALAQSMDTDLTAAGFDLTVLDIAEGNKINALNRAELAARYADRVFIDADVVLGPTLLSELAEHLKAENAVYASGAVRIPRPRSLITRAFAKVWTDLPFYKNDVPGIGLYAVNAAGRARWGAFPPIIADDRFVRLQFAPHERRKAKATYQWPLPEGFRNLVNVRHRWAEGNLELATKFPDLLANEVEVNKTWKNALGLLRTPFASMIYVLIYVVSSGRAKQSVRQSNGKWLRGRD